MLMRIVFKNLVPCNIFYSKTSLIPVQLASTYGYSVRWYC